MSTTSLSFPGDLVQDVFVKILEELLAFRYDPGSGRFRAWLRTVCRNQWLNHRCKRGNQLKQRSLGC